MMCHWCENEINNTMLDKFAEIIRELIEDERISVETKDIIHGLFVEKNICESLASGDNRECRKL